MAMVQPKSQKLRLFITHLLLLLFICTLLIQLGLTLFVVPGVLMAIAFALAPARVYAAEGDRAAQLALKGAAGAAQRQIFAEHRDLYRRPLTAAELGRFDAVVMDPPRAGAREQALGLAAAEVGRLGYVSCNPSSFARDAQILCEGGWRLDWVVPVGQFRWSTHVELVGAFVR